MKLEGIQICIWTQKGYSVLKRSTVDIIYLVLFVDWVCLETDIREFHLLSCRHPHLHIPKRYYLFPLIHIKVICGNSSANTVYGTNAIRTTRYNLLNCIPLYLWDVFNPKYKLANIFFLIVSILQCIPSISLTNGLPSSLPSLLTIIGAEAVHMGILEHKRRKSDRETNSRKVICWDSNTNEWKEVMWKEIHVCCDY